MLCSSRIHRPDKALKNRLALLAYSLTALAINLILFFLYPEYVYHTVFSMFFITILSLFLAAKTIKAGEIAISYGEFANEILKDDFEIRRIDNAKFEPVLQNSRAAEVFKNKKVFDFLEDNLFENRGNQGIFKELKDACKNLLPQKVEISLLLNNAEEWFEISVKPIFLKKTDIFEGPFSIKAIQKDTCFFWNIRQITAQRNMEKIFSGEKKYLHDFIDDLATALYVCNKDYEIEYANHALAKLLGVDKDELVRHNLKDFLAENSEPSEKNKQFRGNVHLINKSGEVTECYLAQDTFRQNQEIKIRGVIIDGLPNDEILLQKLDHAYDTVSWLFNFAPIGIIFTDPEGHITESNFTAQIFFNMDKGKLHSKSIFSFCSEEDAKALKKEVLAICNDRNLSTSIDLRIKQDKEEKAATIYINPMRKLYSSKDIQNNGLVLHIVDVTEQKNLELQFSQAQKMQAMGQLAGGIAHDFNNLLTAMIGFCDLLLERHGVGDPSFTDLIHIKQNANRATGLVRQLLAFSRKQPLKPKLISITENFAELSHMLKRILGEQIILKFYHGNDLGFVKVDPIQFSQVIINLAVNAKDAMNNQGILSISTRVELLKDSHLSGTDTIKAGEFVVIDVKDTGCGIPKENLTRIFDPFFSTKQNIVGSGTGLGLAMVYGIVRQTEGFIKVDSKVGKGTTFSIYLPRFEQPEEMEEIKETTVLSNKTKNGAPVLTVHENLATPGNIDQKLILGLNISSIDQIYEKSNRPTSEIRILFVEDEDSVRAFGLRALKKKGYQIIGCNSAENALEILENDKNFHLLITDMVMPGMSGAALAQAIRKQIPDIKIILASGYSEEITRKDLAGSDDFEFMAKPFSLGDLTKKVSDILNS